MSEDRVRLTSYLILPPLRPQADRRPLQCGSKCSVTDLVGKIAVVTGAGRGIGRRIGYPSRALSALMSPSSPEANAQLHETAAAIDATGGKAAVVPLDLGRQTSHELIQLSLRRRARPAIDPDQRRWHFRADRPCPRHRPGGLDRDADGQHRQPLPDLPRVCGRHDRSRLGRIVNVTSAASLHEPGPINSAYGTSKAALNQFTRHLAAEIAGTGVTANVIHPGDVKTEMWAEIRANAARLGHEASAYKIGPTGLMRRAATIPKRPRTLSAI